MANPLFNSLNITTQQNNTTQLKQAYNMFRNASNPRTMIYQLVQNNPQLQPLLQILNSGQSPELIFRQMAAQRGINPDEFIKQFKD